MIDWKAARRCSEWLSGPTLYGDPELVTLSAAHLELLRLAEAVLKIVDRNQIDVNALRKAIEESKP